MNKRETEREIVRREATPEGKPISPNFLRAILEVDPEEPEEGGKKMFDENILKIAQCKTVCSITYEKPESRITIDFIGNEEIIVLPFGVFVHRIFLSLGEDDDIEEMCKLYPISELLKVAELIREPSFIGNVD